MGYVESRHIVILALCLCCPCSCRIIIIIMRWISCQIPWGLAQQRSCQSLTLWQCCLRRKVVYGKYQVNIVISPTIRVYRQKFNVNSRSESRSYDRSQNDPENPEYFIIIKIFKFHPKKPKYKKAFFRRRYDILEENPRKSRDKVEL